PERLPRHAHGMPERIPRAEQMIDGALLDDEQRRPAAQLGGGEHAPVRDLSAQDFHEAIVRPEDAHVLRPHPGVVEPIEGLRPDRGVVNLRQPGDRLRFLRPECRPNAHLARQGVRVQWGRGKKPQDPERGRSDDLQRVDDLFAEPGHDRRHRHHGRDADDDAEDREPGAELVGAELIDGTADSAWNGRRLSRRAARSDLRTPISRVRSFTLISMMFMMTIPPTTMPIATTAGTTVKITRVSLPQNAMRPSPVSTVKSSSCPGRSRRAIRIASSARSMPSATAAAAGILTEITVVCRRPYRVSNVVSGSMTKPSQDCPSTVPFFAITPFTLNWVPRTRITSPIARSTFPKSLSPVS